MIQGGTRWQGWAFTVSITVISRVLLLREALRRSVFPRAAARNREDVSCEAKPSISAFLFRSGSNLLDACLVETSGPAKAAVLVCHGIGETVDDWEEAQRQLAACGVSSMVFSYSGLGRSGGRVSSARCEADAIAAFHYLRSRLPTLPVSILGFSLGSGVAIAVASRLSLRKLILCSAYTSLCAAAHRMGVPKVLARLIPKVWANSTALAGYGGEVLVVHGAKDVLFPTWMAVELAEASGFRCELVIVPGVSHNGPVFESQDAFWALIASRL